MAFKLSVIGVRFYIHVRKSVKQGFGHILAQCPKPFLFGHCLPPDGWAVSFRSWCHRCVKADVGERLELGDKRSGSLNLREATLAILISW